MKLVSYIFYITFYITLKADCHSRDDYAVCAHCAEIFHLSLDKGWPLSLNQITHPTLIINYIRTYVHTVFL